MPCVDFVVESPVSKSVRKKQLEGIFEVPPMDATRCEWSVDLPYEEKPWAVGLIVGPSGSGKTQIGRRLFGDLFNPEMQFRQTSVIDDFADTLSISEISAVCQAVGFNTIPSWLKPFTVLSNGEKFRVELARRLIEGGEMIVVDEFTSVVDRQVAKIASHAVQKYIRKKKKQFVAATCHYDVIEWLQPDWIFDMATNQFQWRLLQRRPEIRCTVSPVPYGAWSLFAPFHYMSRDLNHAARCFGLFIGDQIVSFAGVIFWPISRNAGRFKPIFGVSRVVTLPDYQGLGCAFVLIDAVASVYTAIGRRFRIYPGHPAFIRALDRSAKWRLIKRPGITATNRSGNIGGIVGGRPNAVFEYVGPSIEKSEAERVMSYFTANKRSCVGAA